MESFTATTRVTFSHPFRVGQMEADQEPGTFDLLVEKIPLDVSWQAYRLSCTLMISKSGATSAWAVSVSELDAALAKDKAHDINTGHS